MGKRSPRNQAPSPSLTPDPSPLRNLDLPPSLTPNLSPPRLKRKREKIRKKKLRSLWPRRKPRRRRNWPRNLAPPPCLTLTPSPDLPPLSPALLPCLTPSLDLPPLNPAPLP